jgi:hypothetical protein
MHVETGATAATGRNELAQGCALKAEPADVLASAAGGDAARLGSGFGVSQLRAAGRARRLRRECQPVSDARQRKRAARATRARARTMLLAAAASVLAPLLMQSQRKRSARKVGTHATGTR